MYLCYHHNDMDGKAAGLQVHQYLTNKGIKCLPSMFIKRGYNEPFNESDYGNKVVFIVDLSFTVDSVNKLFNICEGASKVYWIDHHKTSIECLETEAIRSKLDSYDNLHYFVHNDGCGALLSYLYFNTECNMGDFKSDECLDFALKKTSYGAVLVSKPDGDDYKIIPPYYLQLVDSWDRWVFGEDKDPVYFNYGSNLYDTDIFNEDGELNEFWKAVESSTVVKKIIHEGEVCKKYFDATSKQDVESSAYEMTIKGKKALVLNSNSFTSDVFGSKIDDYDLVCVWNYNGKTDNFRYSFYTAKDDVDCAALAHEFDKNGGGHVKAAGFSSDKFLFKK